MKSLCSNCQWLVVGACSAPVKVWLVLDCWGYVTTQDKNRNNQYTYASPQLQVYGSNLPSINQPSPCTRTGRFCKLVCSLCDKRLPEYLFMNMVITGAGPAAGKGGGGAPPASCPASPHQPCSAEAPLGPPRQCGRISGHRQ